MLTSHPLKPFCLAALVCASLARLTAATPDPKQKAVVDLFAQHVIAIEAVYNDAGKVTKLAISNHTGTDRGKAGNKDAKGATPEIFARIAELTDLEAVAVEMQPLADADYQVLGKLKKLRDVRLQYIKKNGEGTGQTPRFVNELPLPLEILEIKHCFGIDDGNMNELKAQPKLRKLEIDTGWANSEAVPFIQKSPAIENLQIHRTTMNDEDLQKIFAALPELRYLEIRPTAQKGKPGRITGASLRGLAQNPKLEAISLGMQWESFPFEGGLDALVGLKNLREITLGADDIKGLSIDDPAIQKLHQARPDIRISVGRKTLGGAPDHKGADKDGKQFGWDWDKGVNTHG